MSLPCDSRVIFLADVSTDVIDYPVAGRREKVRTERTVDTKPVTLFPDIDEEIVDQIPCLIHGSQLCGYERSEEHTSELQSLMRNSYAVFCLKKKKKEKT